jgi:hypothetical protein
MVAVELSVLFIVALVFFAFFERRFSGFTSTSAEYSVKAIRYFFTMKSHPIAWWIGITGVIASFWYLVIDPLIQLNRQHSIAEYRLSAIHLAITSLLILQMVFTVAVIGAFFIFARKKLSLKARVTISAVCLLSGAVFILTSNVVRERKIIFISPNNSITGALVALNDDRFEIIQLTLEKVSAESLSILGNQLRQLTFSGKTHMCMIDANPITISQAGFSMAGLITQFSSNFNDPPIEKRFSIRDENAKNLSESLRDIIYNCASLSPEEHSMNSIISDNKEAFWEFVQGMDDFNIYSEEGLQKALGHFNRAVDYDSCYASAYLYKSYASCLLSERGWENSDTLDNCRIPFWNAADSIQLDIDYAGKLSRELKCNGLRESNIENSILWLRVNGLFYQTYGEICLERFQKCAASGSTTSIITLDFAHNFLNRAKLNYIKALRNNPRAFKATNNLAAVYSDLCSIYLLEGDSLAARENLRNAERAINETIRNDGLEKGYLINLAGLKLKEYNSFDRNPQLLEKAEMLLNEGISSAAKNYWKGYGYYNLACLYSIKGDTAKAKEFLCSAIQLQPFNVVKLAIYDEDLVNIRSQMGQSDFQLFLRNCDGSIENTAGNTSQSESLGLTFNTH